MKKKLLTAVVVVSAFAIVASVAAAYTKPSNNNNSCCYPIKKACCPSVEVNAGTTAKITNNQTANANSGKNTIIGVSKRRPTPCLSAMFVGGAASINTGDAWAENNADNVVMGADVTVDKPVLGKVEVNAGTTARVNNKQDADANSGKNKVMKARDGANIETGAATSVNSASTEVYGSKVVVD